MPNLVGIGNSQVPTNAMLGGLAYQDPAHANLTSVEIENIAAIKAKTNDTAVDVFVYDTRKDSDGGAWRKRTQHTSWYSEGVSVGRGARKEFPAVAVIVAETNATTIYDADDPNLSMWMKFITTTGGDKIFNRPQYWSTSSIFALNGIICIANLPASAESTCVLNYVSDSVRLYPIDGYPTYGGDYSHGIGERSNSSGVFTTISQNIVGDETFNVAMTVLPNAPIDPATGLPRPTIAVGTGHGASVIVDDGTTVVDITNTLSGYNYVTQIEMDEKYVYIGFGLSNGYVGGIGYAVPIPSTSGDVSLGNITAATSNADFRWSSNSTSGSGAQSDYYINPSDANTDDVTGIVLTKRGMSFGTESGLSILLNEERDTNGSVAQVTKDYNTGYMHGDIKGAFLSDTDDTNITGAELVANPGPSFSNTTNWYLDASNKDTGTIATLAVSSGRLVFTHSNTADYWDGFGISFGSLVVGQEYIIAAEVHAGTNMNVLRISDTASQHDADIAGAGATASAGTHIIQFTATATTMYLHWNGYTTTSTITLNSVSVRLCVEDRSINGKGLQVYGTITKTAVANGSDLVAYHGVNANNYLRQPYNSDLNFGTGDFSIFVWVKKNTLSTNHYILDRAQTYPSWDSTNRSYFIIRNTGYHRFRLAGGSEVSGTVKPMKAGVFNHIGFVRRGGAMEFWLNGEHTETITGANASASFDNGVTTPQTTTINRYANGFAHDYTFDRMALFRIGGTAPLPEQVKKMYDDEKALFQENAKCTLYGSSNEVTAVAYDDSNDILHAGTSAGRSEFVGLNRINNTTTAVTTAISASNGLVAEQ